MNQQIVFVEQCKERFGSSSFASHMAELLGVNVDAAYRRIRGVTSLTYDEIIYDAHLCFTKVLRKPARIILRPE